MVTESLTMTWAGRTRHLVVPSSIYNQLKLFCSGFLANSDQSADDRLTIREDNDRFTLRHDDAQLISASDPSRFILDFEGWLIEQFTQDLPGGTLLFHSAGLLVRNRLVLLIGGPGAGKTTAVHELLDHDVDFVSDEMVGYRPAGRCTYSFPRPLSFTNATGSNTCQLLRLNPKQPYCYGVVSTEQVAPAEFDVDEVYVVVLNRHSSAENQGVVSMKPGETIMTTIPHLFLPTDGQERFRLMRDFMVNDDPGVECFQANYTEFSDILDEIVESVLSFP